MGKRCMINCPKYLGMFPWPLPSELGYWTVFNLGIALKAIKSKSWRGGEHQLHQEVMEPLAVIFPVCTVQGCTLAQGGRGRFAFESPAWHFTASHH